MKMKMKTRSRGGTKQVGNAEWTLSATNKSGLLTLVCLDLRSSASSADSPIRPSFLSAPFSKLRASSSFSSGPAGYLSEPLSYPCFIRLHPWLNASLFMPSQPLMIRGQALPPHHSLPINIHNRVRHSMVPPKIPHRRPAAQHGTVIINNAKPAW
jgi:hypothetical protein